MARLAKALLCVSLIAVVVVVVAMLVPLFNLLVLFWSRFASSRAET